MNGIENLIAELCPAGVPVFSLGEIGTTVSGLRGKSKDDFSDGNAPYVSYVEIFNNPGINFVPEKRVKVDSGEMQSAIQLGDVLVTGSSETRNECGMTAVVTSQPEVPIYLNSFCFIWRPNSGVELDPQFMKHLFRGRGFRDRVIETANGVTRQNISKPKFLAIEIPVPPLEVQREVASILNKFTELEAELEAELEVRSSQFNFFKDTLFEANRRHSLVSLESICSRITSGGTPATTNKNFYLGSIPWVRTSEVNFRAITGTEIHISEEAVNQSSAKWIPAKSVVMAMVGATIGKVAYTEIDVTTNQNCCNLIIDNQKADYKYVFFWLWSQYEVIKSSSPGAVPIINSSAIKRLQIPLPPLEEQLRISSALACMQDLIQNPEFGIPGELSARRQQYEYYRDKLLTFRNLEVA